MPALAAVRLAPSMPARAAPVAPARRLADDALRALVAEALLTPKPALVDQRGPGAHHDLDLGRLLRSAHALHGSFVLMAARASDARPTLQLREALGTLGRHAERQMLRATGGSNAHRGAIWALGLLVAAVAANGPGSGRAAAAATAARLAQLPDRFAGDGATHGLRACRKYGVGGARAEAAAGFPHVVAVALPALERARRRGASERCAQLDALMAIMARLDDTCLLHRGGWAAVTAAQRGAQRVLALGGSAARAGHRALLALDAELLRRHASPGGCADLLAAALFLDAACPPPNPKEPWNS